MVMRMIKIVKANRLIKNIWNLFLSMFVTTIGSFLCFLILGKKMTVEDYGRFNTMLALASMIAVFANNIVAGIVANREIAIDSNVAKTILIKFLFIRIISYIGSIIFLLFYLQKKESSYQSLFIPVAIMLIFDVFWELFEQISFGLKITTYSMWINILSAIIWLFLVYLLPAIHSTVTIVLYIYSIICFTKTIIIFFLLTKRVKSLEFIKNKISYKKMIGYSFPYLYNRIIGTAATQLPILLLTGYSSLNESAYYSVGEKFTTPITKLTTVIISAVFPFITKLLIDNRKRAARIISASIQLIISFGTIIAIVLSSTSNIWLIWFLGNKYENAVEAFNYQIWYVIILSIDSIFSMVLSCDYKQKLLSLVTTIDVVLFILGLWRGLSFGSKGVAFAKLASALFCLFYHLLLIAKIYGNKRILINLILSWVIFVILLLYSMIGNNYITAVLVSCLSVVILCFLNRNEIKSVLFYLKQRI